MADLLPTTSLETECPGGLNGPRCVFGEGFRSVRDKVSITFGVMSTIAWYLFGFPQIVENCRSKILDANLCILMQFFMYRNNHADEDLENGIHRFDGTKESPQ
ncbi:hypothetical protein ACTXT7_003497 [Hymenolepis weldensis]